MKKTKYFLKQFKEVKKDFSDPNIIYKFDNFMSQLKKLEVIEEKQTTEDQRLKKIGDVYLPMLYKIVIDYQDYSLGYEDIATIVQANEQISKSLSLITEAIEKVITDFSDKDYLNLSVDMDVLETLLKQDGLVDDGFRIK